MRKNNHVWTEAELEYIRTSYGQKSLHDLAIETGAAPSTIAHKLREMGVEPIAKNRSRRQWSKKEISFLKRSFSTMSATDLADVFGCSSQTVLNKARELGLRKDPAWDRHDYRNRYVGSYRVRNNGNAVSI